MPNIESGDYSMPSLEFSPEKIAKYLAEGKSPQWIKEEQARRNLDLAEEQLGREMGGDKLAA